jgi:hypothetical protein
MPLQDQVISIKFGQGIDTKSDQKQVLEGKLISLQDGVFTESKRVQKRPGNDALSAVIENGSTLTTPLMSKAYYNELIIADGTRLYSYSPSAQVQVDKGPYQSVSVNSTQISINTNSVYNPSVATVGNYSLFSYTTPSGTIFASVRDNVSNCFLIQDTQLSGTATLFPKSVLLSGTTLGVIYTDSSNNLILRVLTISGTGASFGAPVTLGTNVNPNNPNLEFSVNAAFNFIVYESLISSAYAVQVLSINAAGAVLQSATISLSQQISYLICQQDASNNVWIYWANVTTPGFPSLYYAIFNSVLGVVLTMTTITTVGVEYVSALSANNQATGNQFLYFSWNTQAATSSSPNYVTTYYAELSKTAVVSTDNLFINNLEIESRWINYLGVNYAVFCNLPGNLQGTGVGINEQNTYFLIREQVVNDIPSPYAVAKCLFGEAIPSKGAGFLYDIAINGTQVYFAAPFVFYQDVGNSAGQLFKFPLTGMRQIIFNFNDFQAYQSLVSGNVAALNGGIVQMYDGKYCVELGFNVYPENAIPTVVLSGGSIADGTYFGAQVYEWYDAQGNFHQSAPQQTNSIIISGGGGNASINWNLQTLTLTQKQFPFTEGVVISIYRSTVANPNILYKVGQVVNNPQVNFVTFTDTVPDAQVTSVQNGDIELYTTGDVLENNAPPPAMVMMVNNNRLSLVHSESPTNTIIYSKTYNPGTGLSFSNFLNLTIDPRFGNITTLMGMDVYTCVIKEQGIFVLTGDGFDDTGTSQSFTAPQIVPSDVGGLYSNGSILIPDGIIFKTIKGLYILTRGLSVEYFGIDVEAFNSQNVTASKIAPATTQVRFLTSSGLSLVYDYVFKQWGTFSNYQGYSCDVWQGNFVYARTDGKVFIENQTTFLDNAVPYSLIAQLAWFKFASIQGFQRIREILMLGDHLSPVSGHGVTISAAYDFDDTVFSTPVGFQFSGTGNIFQYREFLPRQKCDTVSLLIQEVVTGASGEFIDFTDLSAVVGAKRGGNKLQPSQSVG